MSKYDSDDFSDFFNSDSSKTTHNNQKSNNKQLDSNTSSRTYSDNYNRPNKPKNSRKGSNRQSNSSEAKIRKKLRSSQSLGIVISLIQLVVSVLFMFLLNDARKNLSALVTPTIYIGIGVVLGILFLVVFIMQFKRLAIKRTGKVISILIIIILAIASYFVYPLTKGSFGGKEKVSEKPFVLYLSGTDTFGEISATANGRSDTNILAVVNPKTHTALLLSTPRDAYVELIAKDIPDGNYDKLTHAGTYGQGVLVDNSWKHGFKVSMDTLGNIYDVKVDHYLKLNFTGFADLVEDLGGITIDIEQGFSTYTYGKSYTFNEGKQKLNGDEALTYVRERKSFAKGDMQRGENQVKVIKAIANKMLSTDMVKNYASVMKHIQNSFETNLDVSSLAALQLQLQMKKDYNGWNILSYSTTGIPAGGYQLCYKTGTYLSVLSLDDTSVEIAKELITKVMNGDEVTKDTIKEMTESE